MRRSLELLVFIILELSSFKIFAALNIKDNLADRKEVRIRIHKEIENLEFQSSNLVIYDQLGLRLNLAKSKLVHAVRIKEREDLGQVSLQVFDKSGAKIFDEPSSRLPIFLMGTGNKEAGNSLPRKLSIIAGDGDFSLVGTLSLNEYLLGVLVREMPGTWPIEALKAQAIAARSYTLAQMWNRRLSDFDLEASVLDQDFKFISAADQVSKSVESWRQALIETKEFILVNDFGRALKAYYHSDCGGQTTLPDLVWGSSENYQAVVDTVCEERKTNSWSYPLAKAGLKKLILEPGADEPLKFKWIQSPTDNRINLVEWGRSEGPWKLITGQNFRQLIGFDKIKSTRFITQDLGDRILFKGRGSGHGVGLCQWGSRDWALKGWTADQILAHYYPKAKLAFKSESTIVERQNRKTGGPKGLALVN